MDKAACGLAEAERLVAVLLAGQAGGLPPDISIYRRVVARDLAQVPALCAHAAVSRFAGLGILPSRAEIAHACASAQSSRS